MSDWDANSPGDSDIVSQFPANERAARDAVRDNFGVDHHEENDADVGKHEVIQVLDNGGSPTIAAGEAGIWNDGGSINARIGTAAATRLMRGESGTKMMFYQASAPTGWTQDTSVNDRVLRVRSGSGGGQGGSWTISGVTVDNHALTVSEMPSHDHGGGGNTGTDGSHSHTGSTSTTGSHNHTGETGNAGSHNHSGVTGDAGSHQHGSLSAGFSSNKNDTAAEGRLLRGDPNSGFIGTLEIAGSATGSVGDHDHFISTDGSHDHFIGTDGDHSHSLNVNSNGNHNHTYNIPNEGGGNGHNHGVSADGNWRPSYIDVIAATLD